MGPVETPERVDKLWETIDTRKQGYVDYNGLKKGLKKMDHREHRTDLSFFLPLACSSTRVLLAGTMNRVRVPLLAPRLTGCCSLLALKNADSMLHQVFKTVDTSGDGRIQYNGKRARLLYGPVDNLTGRSS